MAALIGRLFEGPLDIVGDIHGEIEPLLDLLSHLGYSQNGKHPENRRLVFLGDLVDRGPDSPAVLDLVRQLVEDGRAQCVIGNHELNLLRGLRKEGNQWFTNPVEDGKYPFNPVRDDQRETFKSFVAGLPLALERKDLRVVHACWDRSSIDRLQARNGSVNTLQVFQQFEDEVSLALPPLEMDENQLDQILREHRRQPRYMPDVAKRDAIRQMGNPIRVLTSGVEAPADEPFWAGGKWRMVARQKWWDSYVDDVPVIVGHYWRNLGELEPEFGDKYGPDLFEGIEPHHWMGCDRNVYCVDFSVGLRARARAKGKHEHLFRLAAVRWPEGMVIYDDGSRAAIE